MAKHFDRENSLASCNRLVRIQFIMALAHQLGNKDWSAVTVVTRKMANI